VTEGKVVVAEAKAALQSETDRMTGFMVIMEIDPPYLVTLPLWLRSSSRHTWRSRRQRRLSARQGGQWGGDMWHGGQWGRAKWRGGQWGCDTWRSRRRRRLSARRREPREFPATTHIPHDNYAQSTRT
jgi:hypothetical protein